MRKTLRVAALFAVVASVMSCSVASDGLSGSPSGFRSAARVGIAPVLSPSASQAYTTLAAMGFAVTDVRIRLLDLAGGVVLDTVIAFPANSDTLSILLPLDIHGREQQFDATIQLRDASGAVQFSSTQRVTARSASLPSLPAAAITLQYVGPGYNAKAVSVSPAGASLIAGATQQLIATATDQAGAPVTDLIVTWTTSDSMIARITPTGSISATATSRGPRGTVTFTARAPTGIAGTARLVVLPQPVRLAVVSGNGQTGVALQSLATPFTVEVQATDGGKVAGALVSFRAVTSGGDVLSASVMSDSTGRARTIMRLGRNAGSYSFEASSGTLTPVTVGVTATAPPVGAPTQLVPLTPMPASFRVGVAPTQQFSAQLADANGYYVAVAGVSVTATMVVSPGGATSSVTALSNALGVLTIGIPAFNSAGSVLITLTSTTLSNLPYGTFTITP